MADVESGVDEGTVSDDLPDVAGATSADVAMISTATSTTRNVPSGAMPFNCAV